MSATPLNNPNAIENTTVKSLRMKKTKDTSNKFKKNYFVTGKDGHRITLSIKNVSIPFGCEEFHGRNIVNMEIHPKHDNIHHNIKATLTTFEEQLKDPENFYSKEVTEDMKGKGYYPNIRKSENGYIIRTVLFGSPEIYTNIGKFKTVLTKNDIAKTTADVDLEIGTFWIADSQYGFLWYVKKIEVTDIC